jgi:hypothetical protein
LQSLIGLLNFACSVIIPGRAFLRRLIDLTHGIRLSHHFIKLNRESKEDINVWLMFLANYNGRSFFIDERWSNSQQLSLFTDAAGGVGFGAIFGSEYCYGLWPDTWRHRNIAILEFYPIVLSLCLWGHGMANRSVLFFTDNEALVYVINKQSCRDKTLMQFVCKLVLVCLQHNILFKAKHIPATYNRLADLLSRFQVQTFKREAPASVNTYVSAIGYSHKLLHLVDPTKVFYIIQMLKGYGKLGFLLDSRLPITLPILTRLLMAAPHCIGTAYDQCRFQAMCGLAFFAFLCIGEITSTSKQSPIPLCLNHSPNSKETVK